MRGWLELVEGLERTQARIGIVEVDHVADIDAAVVEMVKEAAAIGIGSSGQPKEPRRSPERCPAGRLRLGA
jgi:hypothetical protein